MSERRKEMGKIETVIMILLGGIVVAVATYLIDSILRGLMLSGS